MDNWFSCGQYKCCITGDRELVSLLPAKWIDLKSEQRAFSRIVTIRLERAMIKDDASYPDGWTVLKRCPLEAAYIRNGKAFFSLVPANENEVILRVRNGVDPFTHIGIHYSLMLALYRQCVGLHGVTLVCGNEIIILAAPSGTGKTTLSKLLEKYYDAVVINGDFALLSPTEDGIIYEPTPFCGSSGRSLNHRFRVNRVVFLGQAQKNTWRDLSGRETMAQFLRNTFVPDWDGSIQQAVQQNILRCISGVKVSAYDFAPTQEAAEMFLQRVEKSFSLTNANGMSQDT